MKKKIGRKERENRIKFFTYISPWLIGLTLFTIVPMFLSIIYSLTDVKMTTVNSEPLNFIGLQNFIYIFTEDKDFQQAIVNTFTYAIIKVALIVVLSLLFALILNRKIFGRKTFRVMLYLPAVIPVVSVSLLWKLIFTGGEFNVANYFLSYLGLAPVNFFANGTSAMGTLIFVGVWSGLGPTMLILLAAIQGVNQELIEASQLDGANAFQRLIHIIIPSISKAMVFVILTSMISALQAYAEVDLLTAGGPGNSTMTMSLLIVQNAFKTLGKKTLGYACAQGWVVFLLTFGLALIYVILSTKKEKEDKR
jgi:multiple sugar transport system permease protein